MEVQPQLFLIFTVNRAKRQASHHTRERTFGAHWIRGQACLFQQWNATCAVCSSQYLDSATLAARCVL